MPYVQSHVPTQYVQLNAAGFYDSNQQHICVPQQMQQLQQGASVYNLILQVQPQNNYTVNSNYIHPTEHQQYGTSFPALPERRESPWQEIEYKKRPRTTSKTSHRILSKSS
jgi:hypothetical protein